MGEKWQRMKCASRVVVCTNQDFHEKLYGGNELEPGEVDEQREMSFEQSVKDYLRQEEVKKRRVARKILE